LTMRNCERASGVRWRRLKSKSFIEDNSLPANRNHAAANCEFPRV